MLEPVYLIGYKGNPEEKRVIRMYDAYTGQEIAAPADSTGADTRK